MASTSDRWSSRSAWWRVSRSLTWAMRSNFSVEARRTTPCTSYPRSSRNSARYEPSWPVMPVMRARRDISVHDLPQVTDPGGDHVDGDLVLAPLGDDHVGESLGRLDELLVHGA